MKKFLLLAVMALSGLSAFAYDAIINGIYYNFSVNEAEVTYQYSGSHSYTGSVVIPETITYSGKTYNVTRIGSSAFQGCTALTSVTIPNSVAIIGSEAFEHCISLTSVTIPNSVTNIGISAFYDCRGLTFVHISDIEVWCNVLFNNDSSNPLYYAHHLFMNGVEIKDLVIPNSVTSIGSHAFFNCTSLTSITIPESVTSIGGYAFSGCTSLTSVSIPNSVTSIGQGAFENCSGMTSVTIPNSVTSIGLCAFCDCRGLTSIKVKTGNTKYDSRNNCNAIIETATNTLIAGCQNTVIPNSVTRIGGYAFYGCSGLTSVTIPNSVTSIGSFAFYGCSSLTSVTIPKSVTSIDYNAFRGCSSLTSVTIPNSVTSIGSYAFYGCSGLTSVTIPKSVTSIGQWAFSSCQELTDVYCYAENVPSTNSDAFEGSDIEYATLHIPAESIERYKAKAPWSSFGSINSLKEINGIYYDFSDNEAKVIKGENAYSGDVVIPASVTYKGKSYNVTSIGDFAFFQCGGLTSISIPNRVTSIGESAFSGCSGLTSVTLNSNTLVSENRSSFTSMKSIFGTQVKEYVIGNNVTGIGSNAFRGCDGLTSVTIPGSVTSIEGSAFSGCSGLTSITIPGSVTSIGGSAFSGCSGLTSIKVETGSTKYDSRNNCNAIIETATNTLIAGCKNTIIPNSVTSIGGSAFGDCRGLTSITIPGSVTSIGGSAFSGCSGLTSVTIPNSVTSIGGSAFSGCSSLTSVTLNSNTLVSAYRSSSTSMKSIFGTQVKEYVIGNNVTGIGGHAFYDCSGLTSVTIPNSVTSIGNYAFDYCNSLTSVTLNSNTLVSANRSSSTSMKSIFGIQVKEYVIGNNVTGIGSNAFYGCSSLTSIIIPDSVTSIGEGAFSGCGGLTSVTIPNSVTSIGESVFYGCRSLTSVTIPNSVTSIGNYAFDFCNSLTSVTIPNSVTSIGVSAFSGCSGLTSVHIADLEAWCKIHFNTSSSNPLNYAHHLFMNGVEIKDLVIPNSVTSISGNAFSGCSGLTSITIPGSVTRIGYSAFCNCNSLTSITIPGSVTSIDGSAFSGCSGLTSVTIPNSVTSIDGSAFSGCSGLTSVTIPNSVTSIGGSAFSGCSGLTSVTLNSNTLVSAYRSSSTSMKSIFGTQVKEYVIGNNVTRIGSNAFYDCSGLTSVTIPNSVTSIGYSAFYNCSGLTSFTIPESVFSIGNYAFRGCSGLTSVTIPKSVTSIGNNAFYECSGLTSVTIPNSVTSIEGSAFSGCSGLTSITIGRSVTSIGDFAFANCGSLKEVYCNAEKVPNADSETFSNTDISVATLHVPENLTDEYSATSPWNQFGKIVALTDESPMTTTGPQLDNSSFDEWSVISGSSGRDLYLPWGEGKTPFWDTNNTFATIVSVSNSTYNDEDGRRYANLQTKFLAVKLVAGAIFTGSYIEVDGTNSVISLGRPFTERPAKMKFDFQYNTSIINKTGGEWKESWGNYISRSMYEGLKGQPDSCQIYIALGDWEPENYVTNNGITYTCPYLVRTRASQPHLFDLNDPHIIGYAQMTRGENIDSWTTETLDIHYRNNRTPKYIIVFATSSKYGDYFTGGDASLLKLDNVELLYGTDTGEEVEDDTYIDGIYYKFSENNAEVVRGDNVYSGSVDIPASVLYKGKTYNVTSIGESAFYRCQDLTSVSIPGSVNTIGEQAFLGCNKLTSINLPNGLTIIGGYAFCECSALTSVTIPNSVTHMGKSAFLGCFSLTSVALPNSVTDIGESVFSSCRSLTSINIPNSVTSISGNAFSYCTGLTSVTIGSNVTSIGNYAFAACESLKDVYCDAEKVPNAYSDTFFDTDVSQATLHVPGMCKEAYRTTSPWNQFGTIVSSSDEEPTITGMQLDNSSFDEWSVISGSSGRDLYLPWGEGKTPFWDTNNTFATIVSVSNSTYNDEDGRRYANLQTKYLAVKLVAGAIFTGSYLEVDATNSVLSLGRPFTERPTKMKFDFQYHSSTINRIGGTWKDAWGDYVSQSVYESLKGQPDSCQIYIALGDWEPVDYVDKSGGAHTCPYLIRTRPSQLHLFDPNDPHIIGYAQMTCGKDISSWTTETLDIHYRSDRTPKYIIVYATSSKYGDFSTGGELSELNLDNIELIYSSIPDIDPEPVDSIPGDGGTFVEKLANGVEMEFKVVSKEGKTCQVGSGTSHCIDTNTTGEITIPSEVRELNVVAIGDNAFSQCNDLSSVTIPSSVTSIGQFAFKDCKLHNILIKCEMPPAIEENAFTNQTFYHAMLYIPTGSWDAYAYDDNWYRFINIRETATSEEQLSMQQAYTLMDASTFTYSVYDPVNNCIGTINSVSGINEDNPNHSWQMIEAGGARYLYNIGAKKYVKRNGNDFNLTDVPEPIEVEDGDNGIILGAQPSTQWALVSNERMSVAQNAIEEVTAIVSSIGKKEEETVYSLSGQRQSTPKKGINIIGSKKVMIK